MLRTSYYPGGLKVLPPGNNRSQEYDDVAGTFTTWDTNGVQISQRALTADEVALLASESAVITGTTNQATLQSRAQSALAANATFLGLASPTQAQTLAQVQLLTKECNALIRLALNLLDSTAGT